METDPLGDTGAGLCVPRTPSGLLRVWTPFWRCDTKLVLSARLSLPLESPAMGLEGERRVVPSAPAVIQHPWGVGFESQFCPSGRTQLLEPARTHSGQAGGRRESGSGLPCRGQAGLRGDWLVST